MSEEDIQVEAEEPEVQEEPIEVVEEGAEAEAEAPQTPPKEVTPEEGIEDFKKQLAAERAAREESERRAYEAEQRARKSDAEMEDNNFHLLNSAIETAKKDALTLKASYAAALREGDFDAAAEYQEQISANSFRLGQLENGKAAMEEAKKNPPPAAPSSDSVEALASTLTPKSAQWVRAHPEYAKNAKLYQKVIAAHNFVTADGVEPESDEYFEKIENMLGIAPAPVKTEEEDAMSDAAKPVSRRSQPPAAPTSRSTPGSSSVPNRVTLSSAEREMAEMMGMTYEEYARNKLALKKEGRMN